MLVLSRKKQEAIYIGPDIRIVVVAIEAGRVKIGIDALKSINIWREELEQKEDENESQA